MKPTIFVTLLAAATSASAWRLELTSSDGRKISMHGTKGSGCKNIEFTPYPKVKKAYFNPKTSWWPDPDRFELFVNRNCDGLSYRNNGGNWNLNPPRTIKSYRVK
ncbi:hypothetical protein VTJ04DRAFT_7647 [Mycothermus thermophilus]|uniref:uncharacterized protein n=1 Tax=Humicola insolens TaxID=85995 RepID=UPI003741EB40